MNHSDRHLRFGWRSLFVFLVLGVVLETLHGFKLGWYLDVGAEMRRLMFTLAHAHGTLLAMPSGPSSSFKSSARSLSCRSNIATSPRASS